MTARSPCAKALVAEAVAAGPPPPLTPTHNVSFAVSRIGARGMSQIHTTVTPAANYRHEALFCSGEADFLDRTAPFIRAAVEDDETGVGGDQPIEDRAVASADRTDG